MIVEVVTASNRHTHEALVRAMHRDRKRVFVDRYGWNVPVVDGDQEIDQFDTGDAVYLIASDDGRQHLGSTRLLPTTAPHLLSDLFPQLAGGMVPRGPAIMEMTRLVYSPDISDPLLLDRVRMTLRVAVMEYALRSGIGHYTAIVRMEFLPTILSAGWTAMPLGLPTAIDGEMTAAVLIDMTEAALAEIRMRTRIAGPVLRPDDSRAAAAA